MRWISAALGKAASAPDAAKALGARVEAARLAIAAETRSSFLMNCTLGFETFHRPVGSRRRHDRPVIGRVRAGLTACAPGRGSSAGRQTRSPTLGGFKEPRAPQGSRLQ